MKPSTNIKKPDPKAKPTTTTTSPYQVETDRTHRGQIATAPAHYRHTPQPPRER